MRNVILSIAAILLLAGCSSTESDALAQAKAAPGPTEALKIIQRAAASDCKFSRSGLGGQCLPTDALRQAENEYFSLAAKAGDERVLRQLFTQLTGEWEVLQNELKSSVLARAKTSANADLLATAASIYGNDKIGIRDSAQQLAYLQRAWLAGDDQSAGSLAHLYVRLHDYENAYFWSLRCIRSCDRQNGVQIGEQADQIGLQNLESNLRAEQIANLQAKASKQAVEK